MVIREFVDNEGDLVKIKQKRNRHKIEVRINNWGTYPMYSFDYERICLKEYPNYKQAIKEIRV